MVPPKTSRQTKTCRASAVLSADEARILNALPGADFTADTEPLGCDFTAHEPGMRHAACAQMQSTDSGDLALWWLLWDDGGSRELRMASGCQKLVVDETCLLIDGHPGNCDENCCWGAESGERSTGGGGLTDRSRSAG